MQIDFYRGLDYTNMIFLTRLLFANSVMTTNLSAQCYWLASQSVTNPLLYGHKHIRTLSLDPATPLL